MNLFQGIIASLYKALMKQKIRYAGKASPREKIDRVDNFNRAAPSLFTPKLMEYGYDFIRIENSEHNAALFSTHHIYTNKSLNLTLDIQQAPYYSDYGFSIFLRNSLLNETQLLCNVPQELQDKEDRFLISICDKFFSRPDLIALLKGENWNTIKPVRIE